MLRKLGVRNFYCFEEGVELNLEFDGKVPEEVKQGSNCASVMGIKGANGSGKTNLIKAINFLKHLCAHSADTAPSHNDPGPNIKLQSFFGSQEPSEFYVDFSINGFEYRYELEVDQNIVHSEALYCTTPKTKKVFIREKDEFKYLASDVEELSFIVLRSDASVLSLAKNYRFKSDMQHLSNAFQFFIRIIANVGFDGFRRERSTLNDISAIYHQDEDMFAFVRDIIQFADPSIKHVYIESRENSEGRLEYFPVFVHSIEGVDKHLPYAYQAEGTKSLFKKLFSYWLVLKDGGVLALDEFDIHLHALILPKLLGLFINEESNKHGAQLIFTAHNTEIIDTLGKYRTVLVNKEGSASYCYRLDEFKGSLVRNDRTIIPLYLKGKLGGVPPKAFQ